MSSVSVGAHISISTYMQVDEEKTLLRVHSVLTDVLGRVEHFPPFIHTTALQFYQKLYEADIRNKGVHVTRRSHIFVSIIAACVYYSLKHHSMDHTVAEICGLFQITRAQFSKGCHHCANISCLPLHNNIAERLYYRFANELRLPYSYIRYGWDSLYMPIQSYMEQYKPAAIAGGLIAAVLEIIALDSKYKKLHSIHIRDVCEFVGVCSSIIRSVKDTLVKQEYHDETKQADDGFDEMFNDFFGGPCP